MDTVVRAGFIYVFLFLVFRFSGKRTMAQITTFDFVMLLIVSEAVQNAMVGNDYSLTNGVILVLTLFTLEIALSILKQKSKKAAKWLDGLPLILVKDGKPFPERLDGSRVDEEDILDIARRERGLEAMEDVKFAVLERDGNISVIPAEGAKAS